MTADPRVETVSADKRFAQSPPPGNHELFERAGAVIPGGVNSPVRAFRSVGGEPYFVASGFGSKVTDADCRTYIDYVQSYGASVLGHAHPRVVEAVTRQLGKGFTFGAPTEGEVMLAEKVCGMIDGCDRLRLVSSGTEAVMTAIRLARGATGRSRILKFEGCYHGHSDALLVKGGSGIATLGLGDSAGITAGSIADTLVAPYNQVPTLDESVACVIVEPVAANMGLVAPVDGFLEGLRAECDRTGALLIFDEVITGFRVSPNGSNSITGVRPDIYTFGKILGGGLPIGAVGGGEELMSLLAPLGPVYQAGTLSGSPIATAAGLAVLDELESIGPSGYQELAAKVSRLAVGLASAFEAQGIDVRVPTFNTLFGIFFSPLTVNDFEGAQAAANSGRYPIFFHSMLSSGVAFAPGAYEAAFMSFAHTDEDVDVTIEAATATAKELAKGI